MAARLASGLAIEAALATLAPLDADWLLFDVLPAAGALPELNAAVDLTDPQPQTHASSLPGRSDYENLPWHLCRLSNRQCERAMSDHPASRGLTLSCVRLTELLVSISKRLIKNRFLNRLSIRLAISGLVAMMGFRFC